MGEGCRGDETLVDGLVSRRDDGAGASEMLFGAILADRGIGSCQDGCGQVLQCHILRMDFDWVKSASVTLPKVQDTGVNIIVGKPYGGNKVSSYRMPNITTRVWVLQ